MTATTRELKPWSRNQADEALAELEQKLGPSKGGGNDIRFPTCPHCWEEHKSNPAFSVNPEKAIYFCHSCGEGGHLSQITGSARPTATFAISRDLSSPKPTPTLSRSPVEHYEKRLRVAGRESLTDLYLQSRGIRYPSWCDFDLPLREIVSESWREVAVYPFLDEAQSIVALQRMYLKGSVFREKERRYLGPKSQGVAVLKSSDKLIVAEGLETGLAVRQYLGNEHGLVICGDAGNLAKLASAHAWAMQRAAKIIIAADNDLEGAGISAARQVFAKFHKKTSIFLPAERGQDWNDVLKKGQMEREFI